MKTFAPFLLLLALPALLLGQIRLKDKTTAATPAGDDWLYLDGTTNGVRKLSPLYYQPLDTDLTSWAALSRAAGFDTFATTPSGANLASLLTTALPAAKGGTGLTALSANVVALLGAADYAAIRTQLALTIGTDVQAFDADLTSIAANTTGGFLTRTAANTYLARAITGTAAEITVANGDGVSGAPTLSLPSALTFTGKTVTGGTFNSPTLVTPALGTPASGNLANATGYPGTSALTTTGALNSGSITSGFGSIDLGADALTAGAGSFTTIAASGAASVSTVLASGATVDLFIADRAAGNNRAYAFYSSGSKRVSIATNATAESGSNAGSDLLINRYSDAGAFLGSAITVTRSTGAVSLESSLAVNSTTDSTSTSTGALVTAGGLGVAKRVFAGPSSGTLAAGYLPYHSFTATGTPDAGGTTDLRGLTVVAGTAIGAANNIGIEAIDAYATHAGTGLAATMTGVFSIPQLTNTGNATNVFGYQNYPNLTGAGNITGSYTGFRAATPVISSTGDITGTITGFRATNIGRAAATTLAVFDLSDQTKGSGNAYGYRGQMASGTGKYNLYMDGTAQNYLAGLTGIGTSATTTSALSLPASTTGVSSLNIPHGTAPASPVDGAIWTTTAGVFARINGATVGPL